MSLHLPAGNRFANKSLFFSHDVQQCSILLESVSCYDMIEKDAKQVDTRYF